MKFQKGQPRPANAGRKKGTPNKATAKREAEIAASGLTPLEYMLAMLRDESAAKEDRMWAAQAAAPYVHPKLATTTIKGDDENPVHFVVRGTGKVPTAEAWEKRHKPDS